MSDSTGRYVKRGTRPIWAAAHDGIHLCECGCGEYVPVKPTHYPDVPRFVWGHNWRGERRTPPKPVQKCECGCGVNASPGRRYLPHHARRPRTSARHLVQPCACGCGETTKPGSRFMKGHNMRRDLDERFWEKVEKGPGCWLWTAAKGEKGYGLVSVDGVHTGAHRVAWELTFGPIPAGLEIDHLCFVRACVNPAHLEPVTHAENTRRARAR